LAGLTGKASAYKGRGMDAEVESGFSSDGDNNYRRARTEGEGNGKNRHTFHVWSPSSFQPWLCLWWHEFNRVPSGPRKSFKKVLENV